MDPSVGDPDRFRERHHVLGVLRAIAASPAAPDTAVVLSAHRRHRSWSALAGVTAPLVVALGDEDARLRRALVDQATAVLQCYRPDDPSWPAQVLRLPLGPGGPPPDTPARPWQERDLDVVFVGHLHPRRWALARGLGAVKGRLRALPDPLLAALRSRVVELGEVQPLPDRRTVLRFTERFGAGLPSEAHLSLLSRARIALVPPGFKQDETFRHHEAARAGCVLVGAPLPDYPVIPVPRPQDLLPLLVRLLDDEDGLYERHLAVVDAWRERGCSAAVGRRLAAQLSALSPHLPRPTR